MIKKAISTSVLIFFIIVLLNTYFNITEKWYSNILAYLIPIFCIILFIIFILSIIRKNIWIYPYGIVFTLYLSLWCSGHFSFFSPHSGQSEKGHGFTVYSHNISFFSMPTYRSKQYKDPQFNTHLTDFKTYIKREKPDLVCLQEFFNDPRNDHYNTISYMDSLGYNSFYLTRFLNPKNGTFRGLVIFSLYPISSGGEVVANKNIYNGAIYADIVIDKNDTLKVINAHLQSMQLGKYIKHPKIVYHKLVNGMKERFTQKEFLMDVIDYSAYPVLLCGDFNEPPTSQIYHSIHSKLNNSHQVAGPLFGSTLSVLGVKLLRIDHQFFGDNIYCNSYRVGNIPFGSNHFPTIGTYSID